MSKVLWKKIRESIWNAIENNQHSIYGPSNILSSKLLDFLGPNDLQSTHSNPLIWRLYGNYQHTGLLYLWNIKPQKNKPWPYFLNFQLVHSLFPQQTCFAYLSTTASSIPLSSSSFNLLLTELLHLMISESLIDILSVFWLSENVLILCSLLYGNLAWYRILVY